MCDERKSSEKITHVEGDKIFTKDAKNADILNIQEFAEVLLKK